MSDQIDISQLLNNNQFDLVISSNEPPEDRSARLRRENFLFYIGLIGLIFIFCASFYFSFFGASARKNLVQFSHNILTAIVSGFLSFKLGKKYSK